MGIAAAALGFAFGFVGSIPVAGPVAALVLRRGLEDRVRSALCLAAGAALVEATYAYLAFRGFAAHLARHAWIESGARIAAVILLAGLGLHFARGARPAAAAPIASRVGNARSFVLGLTLTAMNPVLIATWTAAVTLAYGLGLARFEPGAALPFSAGACAGITAWFAALLGLLQRFRRDLSRAAVDRLVRGMGVLLTLVGLGFAARFAAAL